MSSKSTDVDASCPSSSLRDRWDAVKLASNSHAIARQIALMNRVPMPFVPIRKTKRYGNSLLNFDSLEKLENLEKRDIQDYNVAAREHARLHIPSEVMQLQTL